jgi:2-methylisocitrate lyase-like PEP mutase family enzyme
MNQSEKAALFRGLHVPTLVLPNAWDAGSARVIEVAGAQAIATGSAAVSWAYGMRDGNRLRREDVIDVVGRIVRTVSVPVSVDIEGGYGAGTARDVEETVRGVVQVGAVGINLEDARLDDEDELLEPAEFVERMQAAKGGAASAGGDVVINARTDVFLAEIGPPASRLGHAVERANSYLAAGADCVFVPGVQDAATIGALVQRINGPVNVLIGVNAPAIGELKRIGVARVSAGPRLAEASYAVVQNAARELLEQGTYESLRGALRFDELQQLFK